MTSDRVALVTGANKGLGYETARQLARLGLTVVLGSRNDEQGKRAAAELAAGGSDVTALPVDVTDARRLKLPPLASKPTTAAWMYW